MNHTPPGPTGLPGIGNSYRFSRDPLKFITDYQKSYGNLAKMKLGNEIVYLVMHPHLIKRVLSVDDDKYKKPEYHPNMDDLFGNGMLLGNGNSWLHQRQRAQPSFNIARLKDLTSAMVNHTENLLSDWSDGDSLYINYQMGKLALKIISDAMFEYELEDAEIRSLMYDMKIIGEQLEPNVSDLFLPPRMPSQSSRKHQNAASNIDELLNTIIRDRGRTEVDGESMDYLSSLLQDHPKNGVDKKLLQNELTTMLLAGNDTTATVMSFSWYLLACHTEVAQKLYEEVDEVLDGQAPTFSNIQELTYTERVLKESMRLYPPIYSVLRESTEKTELNGYHLSKGSIFMLPQWGVHRDSRWYDEPERFYPDRWVSERTCNRPEYAYFPFGGGTRRCIGEKFAMMEAKIVLSLITQQYQLELVSDDSIELAPSITLHPDSPIEMRVNDRN